MTRIILIFVVLIAAVSPARAQQGSPGRLLERFVQAWNISDVAAISALFALDADLVAPDGVFAKGRTAIAGYYATAFARGYTGSTLTGKLIQQRTLAPGLTILDVQFDIAGAHKPDGSVLRPEHGAIVAVMRKGPGGWQILAQRERDGSDFIPFAGR